MKKTVLTGLLTLSLGIVSTIAGQTVKQKIDRPKAPTTATQNDAPMVKKRIGHLTHRRNIRSLITAKTSHNKS